MEITLTILGYIICGSAFTGFVIGYMLRYIAELEHKVKEAKK